ncbi:MAG: site-specific integrase [Tannerella sp.]|jgi:integrase|nr:site-specific integrase [Tannerella sp.]
MASILIKLDKRRPNAEGDYPVKLQIFNNQTNASLSLSYYVPERAWAGDGLQRPIKAAYPGSKLINDRIEQFYLNVRDVIISLEHSGRGRAMKAVDIKKHILAPTRVIESSGTADFFGFAANYIDQIRAKRTKAIYESTITKIKGFTKNNSISFEDINYQYLRQFDSYLSESGSGVNTRSIHFRNIRALFNRAIDDEMIGQTLYPFRKFKIKTEQKDTVCLTACQVRALYEREFKTESLRMARDYWMLSFFLCGISPIDLFYLKNGKSTISFVRQKEKNKPHETIKLFIQPEAQLIIDRYKADEKFDYLLKFESKYTSYEIFKSFVSKKIREIAQIIGVPGLTMYWARYSWATIADSIGIDEKTISKGLGHVDKTIAGRHYIAFDWSKVDRANRQVIDYALTSGV